MQLTIRRGVWMLAAIILAGVATYTMAEKPAAKVARRSAAAAAKQPGPGDGVAIAASTPTSTRGADVKTETATFGAGCFWGVEAVFRRMPGVISTSVGYTGGNVANPTYDQVCTGRTGHAESVQVVFDPQTVKYDDLLHVFWKNHNPTTKNRQGPDHGTQYRSVIFYQNEHQKDAAEASKLDLEKRRSKALRPIVTEIVPAGEFYRAEEYHQQYLEKNGLENCHLQ